MTKKALKVCMDKRNLTLQEVIVNSQQVEMQQTVAVLLVKRFGAQTVAVSVWVATLLGVVERSTCAVMMTTQNVAMSNITLVSLLLTAQIDIAITQYYS